MGRFRHGSGKVGANYYFFNAHAVSAIYHGFQPLSTPLSALYIWGHRGLHATPKLKLDFFERETEERRSIGIAATVLEEAGNYEMTIVEMCVHMDCSGCESKIRKALQKLEGVDNVDVDMGRQKVTVTGWVDQKKVLKAVRKTGRRAVLWPYPYGAENHTFTVQQYYNQHHPALATAPVSATAAPSSSYNYYKHGYDDSRMHGYYQPSAHSAVVSGRAGDIFSVENPNNCSIM